MNRMRPWIVHCRELGELLRTIDVVSNLQTELTHSGHSILQNVQERLMLVANYLI